MVTEEVVAVAVVADAEAIVASRTTFLAENVAVPDKCAQAMAGMPGGGEPKTSMTYTCGDGSSHGCCPYS